jgi:hypothetical protein
MEETDRRWIRRRRIGVEGGYGEGFCVEEDL